MLRCMRTTLTLDDNVAAAIERLRKTRNLTLKEVVNQALREGLEQMEMPPKGNKPFRTRPLDVGQPLVGNVDNIAEVISLLEGDWHK